MEAVSIQRESPRIDTGQRKPPRLKLVPPPLRENLKDDPRKFLKFVVLSLLLHIFFLTSSNLLDRIAPAPFVDTSKVVEIEMVEVPAQKKDQPKRAQVAESLNVEKSPQAKDDAYLGQQTQVVEKQTRAANTAPYRNGQKASGQSAQEKSKAVALGDLGVKMNFKPLGNLGPGELASTSDYLEDVKPGAQTLLNTREYAFFGFYQRVRSQLEQYWEPGLRKRLSAMFERGRRLATDQEHSTRLLVVLNSAGVITKIQVEGTSGLLDLDQAAVDAFNRAGPFPNPPKGMIEHDGTVRVEWEFVLKT